MRLMSDYHNDLLSNYLSTPCTKEKGASAPTVLPARSLNFQSFCIFCVMVFHPCSHCFVTK
jgi:hypothetical protein